LNLATLLTRAARADPRRTALRCGPLSLTYEELDRAASRFGSALLARGLRPGDRVAIFLANRLEYAIALFGAFRAGLVVVPINAKLHPREAAWIVQNAEAAMLLTDSDALDGSFVVNPGAGWAALLEAGDPQFGDEAVGAEELAWLFYTSGTTGFPKGAMLSHRNLLAMTMSCLAEVCDFRRDDVVLHPAPLSHGCGLYLLAALARGALNVVYAGESFDPLDVLAIVERERVSCVSFMAPTQIVRLLDASATYDTSSLRTVVYGGGPIHVDHAREALARFGPVFCQLYGQGEAPMTISVLRPEDHTEDALASAGFVRTNVEVRIVEDEILVRGDVVMAGYWRNPEATEQALRGGWLHTGDLGRFDERGRLFLVDRKHDTIISGGTNIYPREVEDVLVQHPGIREACVFGVPDRYWGESVFAAVVPVGGVELEAGEVIEFCKERLASFKKPKHLQLVEALPKNAYGKVLRRQLRDERIAKGEAASGDRQASE
jgi:acyl-CoA synthetase (AMP-forming)/AMP-acid ligase II